jgi:RNA polymerase sigma-70 factor, ECF subfamily
MIGRRATFFEGHGAVAQLQDIRQRESTAGRPWVEATLHAEVLARCRQGDESAWRDLYRAHFDFVYRMASRLGAEAEALEDICQEVFVVAFRKLDSFVDGRFTAWLYRIVANLVAHRHRQRRLREVLRGLLGHQLQATAVDLSPDRAVEARQQKEVVDAVLRRMGDRQREVLVLFELEGLPGEQVADLCGCKVETVWSRLHYARRDFERILRKMGYAL